MAPRATAWCAMIWLLLVVTGCVRAFTPISSGCDQRSCYPATGNLLIGRADKLSATDTCGLDGKSRYCIISSLDSQTFGAYHEVKEKCYWCDAAQPDQSHNVSNIIYRWEPAEAPRAEQRMTWWQASNGQENVSIQLDLEAEFHVTHIIITFKTFRPAAMYVEKSFDWGKTWKIQRYFAADCDKEFPTVHKGVPRHLEEPVCQERYSRISPSTKGEVIYRVLPPNINIHSPGFNPYSKEVQDLLKTTNLRVTFNRLHKLGDEKLDAGTNPVDIKEKYYYSIYDMIIRGSCSCYGHAERCVPEREEHRDIAGMVHGTCECTHNTKGNNCEHCMDFYHDQPWRPATGRKKNECKSCNCNNHSTKCHFDEAVWEATGYLSGGVCDDCQHNTEGRQCETCIIGFFQDPELPITDPNICVECDCEPDGTVDGGICDGRTDPEEGTVAGQCHCKTFVGGPRCDRCQDGYWNFTVENPDGCQQCTCNPLGTVSLDGCDQDTGSCNCKRNVVGRDCDQCKPEHFGLSTDPLGCRPCDCDPGGAYDNNCDVMSGQCSCRPNIKGRRCDQVEDFYFTGPLDYLLYEAELAHGSDNPPTKVTRRKPSDIEGETTWTGFGHMLVFEGSNLTFDVPEIFRTMDYDLVVRYAHLPASPNSWEVVTAELVRVDGPPDTAGRCSAAAAAGGGQDEIIRLSLPAGQISQEVYPPLCLEQGQRYQIKLTFQQYDPVQPGQASIYIDSIALLPRLEDMPFLNPDWREAEERLKEACAALRAGQLELPEPEGSGTQEGGLDEDSLPPLYPPVSDEICDSIEAMDRPIEGWSPGPEKAAAFRDELERLRCRDHFLLAKPARLENAVPPECMALLHSISYFAFEGAFNRACECSNTGSLSSMCDKYYGGCRCKTLVVGRRCDACAPAAFGFGGSGCRRCDCHYKGSHDEFCNQETGQCNCHNNAFGRQCDECRPGYWSFPDCRQCQCNGHAYSCDAHSGECIDCRDSTTGSFCERCLIGYYGNPILGEEQVPCRECPCPGTKASGHSYAETCYLDKASNQPVCDCSEGFAGERCDICADNYYGNPEIPGGNCQKCNCSTNWVESDTGNCDPHSGECRKCIYFTEGFNCERCMAGYYGDAVFGQCKECQCNMLGTDPERFDCDRSSGRCHCLPNVEGYYCDTCRENHWKIASGKGCEDCDCDPVGSTGPTCDLYVGQCDCKPGFGGRRCDQCEEDFWGDPRVQCIPCNCSPLGVDPDRTQCDHVTGKCFCLEGIAGEKCDECARGYMQYHPLTQDHPVMTRRIPAGVMPDCQKCGECFDNWDRILAGLENKTQQKVVEAEKVKVTGAAGAYTRSFENMESGIEEVKGILSRASISNDELAGLAKDIEDTGDQLRTTTDRMQELDSRLADTKQAILQGQYNLTNLRQDAERLGQAAADVRDQATRLQEANVVGALTLTQQAKLKSDQAAKQVERIAQEVDDSPLYESVKQRGATERLINDVRDRIAERQVNNTNALADITGQIGRLENRVPDLNRAVCDGETSRERPCDSLCGGAGCGKCGGLSCQEGALTRAQEALQNAKAAEKIFAKKDLDAEGMLNKVSSVHADVTRAAEEAQAAFDLAADAKNRSKSEVERVEVLSTRINAFLNDDKATPEQVKGVAYECLNATMTMDTAQIQSLAEQINEAIASVTDVDKINEETAGPLSEAENLKYQADMARSMAAERLATAENVTKSLEEAENAQNDAEVAIASAQADIAAARKDLALIEADMEAATGVSDDTFQRTEELLRRQKTLQTAYIANDNHVKSAQAAAETAMSKANRANADLYKLNADFFNVSASLSAKSEKIGRSKDRALDLQRRANNLANSASSKLSSLLDMEKEYEDNQRQLDSLATRLIELNCKMQIHLLVIQEKSNYYRTCSSPSTWQPSQECACPAGSADPVCTDTGSPARY